MLHSVYAYCYMIFYIFFTNIPLLLILKKRSIKDNMDKKDDVDGIRTTLTSFSRMFYLSRLNMPLRTV